jgi:hypothetical protein
LRLRTISKTAHGSTDHFEINVIGSKKSATWTFAHPDEIYIGEGRLRTLITRTESRSGSKQPPFRGMGWLEGYVEILRQSIYEIQGRSFEPYPNLKDVGTIMKSLFDILDSTSSPVLREPSREPQDSKHFQ